MTIEALREKLKGLPPVQRPEGQSPVGPLFRGMYGNPPDIRVLRIINGNLYEDTPIGWNVYSEGQPMPVLLGHGPIDGDFAIAHIYIGESRHKRYGTVIHRGRYFDNFTKWLNAVCAERETVAGDTVGYEVTAL